MSKTDEMELIISIIPHGLEYMFRIENINEDGYKVIKEKEFTTVEEVLIELGKIL